MKFQKITAKNGASNSYSILFYDTVPLISFPAAWWQVFPILVPKFTMRIYSGMNNDQYLMTLEDKGWNNWRVRRHFTTAINHTEKLADNRCEI